MHAFNSAARLIAALVLSVALTAVWSDDARAGRCNERLDATKITIMGDWLPWASQGPIITARDEGYYEQEGLDVELISPPNPEDTLKLVGAGKIEFAYTYVPEVLMSHEAGVPIISVAALHFNLVNGLDIPGDGSITKPADLRGKIVAVSNLPSTRAEVKTLLESAGLTEDDVTLVDPGFAGFTMFLEGKVDANWGLSNVDPVILNPMLEEAGKPGMRLLVRTGTTVCPITSQLVIEGLEPELALEIAPWQPSRFLRATAKGHEAYLAGPEPAIKKMIAATDLFTPEQQWAIHESVTPDWFNDEGEVYVQQHAVWEAARNWALKIAGLIENKVDADTYFTN